MISYTDYRYRFPVAGLVLAVDAFDALRAAGLLPLDGLPANMLGDPIVLNGVAVAKGRAGRAAVQTIDPDTGAPVTLPAVGDPTQIYVHIRSSTSPLELPTGFDPAVFGLVPTTVEESSAVLGVWA
jgi:hypothetical protein